MILLFKAKKQNQAKLLQIAIDLNTSISTLPKKDHPLLMKKAAVLAFEDCNKAFLELLTAKKVYPKLQNIMNLTCDCLELTHCYYFKNNLLYVESGTKVESTPVPMGETLISQIFNLNQKDPYFNLILAFLSQKSILEMLMLYTYFETPANYPKLAY